MRGVTNALFSSGGKSALDNELFTIDVRTGSNWFWHCFNSHVGIWSRAHDFVGVEVIIFHTSDSETTAKCSNDKPSNMEAVNVN